MAAYTRPGDRVFFIYDHSVTKKEYDDPKDAIIYFFPPHTSIDAQCIFCNQLMGMVKMTKNIAGSPPKLYRLRRSKVATIHEGNFTLALAGKPRIPDSALIRKLENLYRVFVFYHCSVTRVQQISSSNEAFLSNMAAIWDFYLPYVRRYGNTVPAMFEPIQNIKLLKGGNFLFLRCSHLLQWLKGQPSLLAGCVLYKRSVLCSQLTPELTSHLLLIKPNQLHHPSKSVTDTVLPFGVRIMSVYVTKEQYKQLSSPLHPLSKPRRSVQTKSPVAFFYTPPASPTEKESSEAPPSTGPQSTPRRTLERTISSTAGRLFSNFTGMLEGTVIESLWPTGSKSGGITSPSESSTGNGQRETPRYGADGLMKDGESDAVFLSRSSADVVRALQESDGSSGRDSPGSAHYADQTATPSKDTDSGSDHSPGPLKYQNSLTTLPTSQSNNNDDLIATLPGVSPAASSTAALGMQTQDSVGNAETNLPCSSVYANSSQTSLTAGTNLTESASQVEILKEKSHKHKGEDDSEEMHTQADADFRNASTDREQTRMELGFDRNTPLGQPRSVAKGCSIPSEQKSESPESGIGDCMMQKRQEDLSGMDRGLGEKDSGFEEAGENGSVQGCKDVEVVSVGSRPLDQNEDGLGRNGGSKVYAVLHAEGNVTGPFNATDVLCLTDAHRNIVSMKGSHEAYTTEDATQLNLDNCDATQMSLKQSSGDTHEETVTSGEKNASHITEQSVTSREKAEKTIHASRKDQNVMLTDLDTCSKPDVLESTKEEQGENPDLLVSSEMMSQVGIQDEAEDINSNVKLGESQSLVEEAVISGIEDVVCEGSKGGTRGGVGILNMEEENDKRNREENSKTQILDEDANEVTDGQEAQDLEGQHDDDDTGNSCTTKLAIKSPHDVDTDLLGPQTGEDDSKHNSQEHQTLDSEGFAHTHSSEGPTVKGVQSRVGTGEVNLDTDSPGADKQMMEESPSTVLSPEKEPKMLPNAASSPVVEDGQEDVKLEEEVTENRGGFLKESPETRWEEMGETAEDDMRRLTFETQDSTITPEDETLPQLVNVSLYVQAHSDTTLLFLAEKSITKEKDTLFQLWQSVLRELGELELQLKNVVRPDREMDCKAAYNFIHFDKSHQSLEGSIINPVNQVESFFCRGCQLMHEQFLGDETLTDITLRNHQTVVYAHQNACHHTFFHKSYKMSPSPGIPSRDDTGFYIQNSCKEALKEHNVNLL